MSLSILYIVLLYFVVFNWLENSSVLNRSFPYFAKSKGNTTKRAFWIKTIISEKGCKKKKYFKSKNKISIFPFFWHFFHHLKRATWQNFFCLFIKTLRLAIQKQIQLLPLTTVSQPGGECHNVPGKSQLCS